MDDGLELAWVASLIGDTIEVCEKRCIHIRTGKVTRALGEAGVLRGVTLESLVHTHGPLSSIQTCLRRGSCMARYEGLISRDVLRKTWDVNGLAQSKSVYDLTGKTINKNNGLVSATGFEPVTV